MPAPIFTIFSETVSESKPIFKGSSRNIGSVSQPKAMIYSDRLSNISNPF